MNDFLNRNRLDAQNGNITAATSAQLDSVCAMTPTRGHRIALYSHDTMGLGHIRRNLSIAEALSCCRPQPVILMIAGAREAGSFNLPAGVDSLILPALYKNSDGSYRSRCLDVELNEVRLIREKTIDAALEAFKPDVFIADKEPTGAVGELLRPLDSLRRRGHTSCILGLRDIIDDPVTVQKEWSSHSNYEAIRRYYDTVWVYGDASVYDMVREYQLPDDIASITRYTGYLGRFNSDSIDQDEDNFLKSLGLPENKLAICTVGGGQDGAQLAGAFVEMDLPPKTYGLLLTGPYMPADIRQKLHARAATRTDIRVIDFAPRPLSLMRQADCIFTMGGYNTICEALSLGKRLLVVPRISPRQEQLIRAERMQALGLLDVLHPDSVTPEALYEWLCRKTTKVCPSIEKVDLNGTERLPQLLAEALAIPLKSR